MDDEIDIAEATAERGERLGALVCNYRLADGADGLGTALRLRARLDPTLPVLFKPVEPVLLLQALSTIARP